MNNNTIVEEKKYILTIDDGGLCLMRYNEEEQHYIKIKNIEIEQIFKIFDDMIDSKKQIEDMHLNDNVLRIKAIYPFKNCTYKKEKIEIIINSMILKSDTFKLALTARLNKWNCTKVETITNIGDFLYKPENVNKRRLVNISIKEDL